MLRGRIIGKRVSCGIYLRPPSSLIGPSWRNPLECRRPFPFMINRPLRKGFLPFLSVERLMMCLRSLDFNKSIIGLLVNSSCTGKHTLRCECPFCGHSDLEFWSLLLISHLASWETAMLLVARSTGLHTSTFQN